MHIEHRQTKPAHLVDRIEALVDDKIERQQCIQTVKPRHLTDRSKTAFDHQPGSIRVPCRQIDRHRAAERMPVDQNIRRLDAARVHQIIPCCLCVLINPGFARKTAAAFAVAAVIEHEDFITEPAQRLDAAHIGTDVTVVAMQIKQGLGCRMSGRNPPAVQKLRWRTAVPQRNRYIDDRKIEIGGGRTQLLVGLEYKM